MKDVTLIKWKNWIFDKRIYFFFKFFKHAFLPETHTKKLEKKTNKLFKIKLTIFMAQFRTR